MLCGKRFRISPRSFYQINPVQTEKLYRTAIAFAGCNKKERVLDAYCGTGTIGMIASETAKEVIGVELANDANVVVFLNGDGAVASISLTYVDAENETVSIICSYN